MDLPVDIQAGRWSPSLRTRAWARLGGATQLLLVALGILLACGFVVAVMAAGPATSGVASGFGFDTRSYWGFPRLPLYPGPGTDDGFGIYRYSPAFVPFLVMFSTLPWPVFAVAWLSLLVGVYIWMAGDARWPLLVFVPVLFEFYLGNVHLLLAVAIVLGFRWPGAWSFVLLTKVTPGIGLWWFVVRREWRALGIALGVTAAIVSAGLLVSPGIWREWLVSLSVTGPAVGTNQVPVPLPLRVIAAMLLITWGARTDRRWTVVVAATLALPTLWYHGLAMLVGIVALRQGQPERLATSLDRAGQRLALVMRHLRPDRIEA